MPDPLFRCGFGGCVGKIRISDGNRHLRVAGHFSPTADGTSLVRYFEDAPHVTLGREIRVLGRGSFCGAFLEALAFESDSQLL
jgi:hypothetical protein